MLKNILKIDGVQQLKKTELDLLNGGNSFGRRCRQQGNLCCNISAPGKPECEPGRCTRWGCLYD